MNERDPYTWKRDHIKYLRIERPQNICINQSLKEDEFCYSKGIAAFRLWANKNWNGKLIPINILCMLAVKIFIAIIGEAY